MDKKIKSIHEVQKKWEKLGDWDSFTGTASSTDSIIFPMVRRVLSQTLGGVSKVEREAIESRIKSENRDAKIDAIIYKKPFFEKKVEDDPEYKDIIKNGLISVVPMSAPKCSLMYIDYKYDEKK